MKELKKLKLVQLAEQELSDRQMTGLKGGYFCVCGACGVYAASTSANSNANSLYGYKTGGSCSSWYHWNSL